MFLVLFLAAPLVAGCGGSSEDPTPAGPRVGNDQTASAVATPSSATIARGATTTTTVVYVATGGLTRSSFGINIPVPGISVTQNSSQTAGTAITRAYTIGADATVPIGIHAVRFSTPITGYTGNGVVPTASATFTLTVTQ